MHETTAARAHREEAAKKLSKEGRRYFEFIEFDEAEQLITEIRKDPVGLFIVLLVGSFVTIALLTISVIVSSIDFGGIFGGSTGLIKALTVVVSIFATFGSAIMTLIAAFLYVSNVIFVTSEKIAQVLYLSLFNRKISQLSIGDVQDVTVTQKGILAHIFKYGTLVIETAGEQSNYTFTYVPEPYQVSKLIVGAHEENLKLHGN